MSQAHSKASKKRMARFTKEELSQKGRELALKRWSNTPTKKKKAFGQMLTKARLEKSKVIKE